MGSVEADIPHPFDPLSLGEIETVITAVKKAHGDVFFNVVSMHEPRKVEMTAWLADPETAPRPTRVADVVVIAPGGKVYDGLVDVKTATITSWEELDGLQPIVSLLALDDLETKRLTKRIDHYGGAPGCRARLPERPRCDRAV